MKISIAFKCPGAINRIIDDEINYDGNEEKPVSETISEERLQEFLRQWIWSGEYITIDFDTKANTATVKRS